MQAQSGLGVTTPRTAKVRPTRSSSVQLAAYLPSKKAASLLPRARRRSGTLLPRSEAKSPGLFSRRVARHACLPLLDRTRRQAGGTLVALFDGWVVSRPLGSVTAVPLG